METVDNRMEMLEVLVLILMGVFEDFPVVVLLFSATSATTLVTVVSSVMHSVWTMVIILCKLCVKVPR